MFHVLIAEQDAEVRAKLERVLETLVDAAGEECVVSFTGDGLAAFRKAKRVQPRLVLISSSLPLGGGVQIVQALQLYAAQARIVVLANRGESSGNLVSFVQAGAHGVVPKDLDADALSLAVNRVMRGERYFAGERVVAPADHVPSG